MRQILTVGELRKVTAGLHDDCPVGVSFDGVPKYDSYGDGIYAEADSDGDGAWVTIIVES